MHGWTCLRQCIMFSNCGNGFEPISLVDLIERLGLQMLPLDRESHAIQTFQRLAIFFARMRCGTAFIVSFGHDSTSPGCCSARAIRTPPGNGGRAANSLLHQSVLAL